MYTPQLFAIGSAADIHALIRAHPFSILITHGVDGIAATHLPTVLKADGPDTLGRIESISREQIHNGRLSNRMKPP
jgi:predicted FMN-binding regulatory protein PaiB